jgi:hypothetical protein
MLRPADGFATKRRSGNGGGASQLSEKNNFASAEETLSAILKSGWTLPNKGNWNPLSQFDSPKGLRTFRRSVVVGVLKSQRIRSRNIEEPDQKLA